MQSEVSKGEGKSAQRATNLATILIVDDEESNRALLRDPLERLGYQTIEAADGQEALDLVATSPPDLILLDVMLPRVNGFDVCRRLKQQRDTASIPILIVTMLRNRKERLVGIEAGADDFLSKPVDVQEMLLRVGNAVRASKLVNRLRAEQQRSEQLYLRAQRMESIGLLAAGIAHDLNNILAPVTMAVDLLHDKLEGDEEAISILRMLESGGDRGAKLLRQVLSFTRGVEGERVLVDLRQLAADMENMMRETFPKSVSMQLSVAPGVWQVKGNATQLEQVLLNLCVNARDAMPGGGCLTISVENAILNEVTAGAAGAAPGTYVRLRVSDTGEGIPPEIRDKIFEPLFTTKETGKGTGLGLSTALGIVKSHGGFITLDTVTGAGSTFGVYLPSAIQADTQLLNAVETTAPRGRGELILVVDDEKSVLEITRRILDRFGYRTLGALNGSEAAPLYAERQSEIQAVLVDMMMPVMDGPATVSALRKINPAVKIIGCSGLSLDFAIANIQNAGIEEFLPKPYHAEAILRSLDRILRPNLAADTPISPDRQAASLAVGLA